MATFAIIGAGAWGTALACHTARLGHSVRMWALEPDVAEDITHRHANSVYLANVALPESIRATTEVAEAVLEAEVVILVPPSQHLRAVAAKLTRALPDGALVVVATKGIEEGSLKLMSEVLAEAMPALRSEQLAFLSGPTFALEVAKALPTDVVVASLGMVAARKVQPLLHAPMFRVYTSADPVGVQIGGAVKNVMAVATGACDELGFGTNARAALITRGLAEITRLGVALGANPLTFLGMAGVGDLVLTCTGELSRNRTLGKQVAAGADPQAYLASRRSVAEGYYTAAAAYDLARKLDVDMPVTDNVYHVLHRERPLTEAVRILLERTYKDELVGIDAAAPESYLDARWIAESRSAAAAPWRQVVSEAPAEPFDELATLAARVCGTAGAAVVFRDGDRWLVKGQCGVPQGNTVPAALLERALAARDVLVVEDVGAEAEIGFFAGAPLTTRDAEVLGTLSVADRVPRRLERAQREALGIVAGNVVARLELLRMRARLGDVRTR